MPGPMSWLDDYRIHFGGDMSSEKAEAVVAQWQAAARAASRREDIELAAAFQRHYLKFGTGLPPNFCLALTASDVLCFKFDGRNSAHPMNVNPVQIKKQVAKWPRTGVRVTTVEPGRLAIGVTFEIKVRTGAYALQCRTPRLAVNPAAAAMIVALGGTLPG
jgi:hypothetical protein